LHASLMARLDRLGPAAKEVAQIGAVLGREFAYELIEPLHRSPPPEQFVADSPLERAGSNPRSSFRINDTGEPSRELFSQT
jgi:predicted ATPase